MCLCVCVSVCLCVWLPGCLRVGDSIWVGFSLERVPRSLHGGLERPFAVQVTVRVAGAGGLYPFVVTIDFCAYILICTHIFVGLAHPPSHCRQHTVHPSRGRVVVTAAVQRTSDGRGIIPRNCVSQWPEQHDTRYCVPIVW
jgi:hypothetical protein